nr:MAG TPA: hypothetical protein [Caudoviricetes sp.]
MAVWVFRCPYRLLSPLVAVARSQNHSLSVVTARRGLALTAYHPHGAMPIGSYSFRSEYSVLKVRVPSGTLRGFPRGLGC